ncbi:2-isopropylmalate synthase [Cuneatibacter sp. NSJ-177]|uniref:2-isopropylmalate synthase n=1 Tax=Cuneatibacter sp. NSJ-177 TaxID=2931401 RepID=UPI001FD28398|nr:2-isopropylmalate synthase [Cuneatibacter sp. NSJ-177]MCJ7834776.1 2-isopropylmalate synthase [Cuneatibacter sp. NSJ-177]
MNPTKYHPPYYLPPVMTYDWVKKTEIDSAPIWCSVDLRDGNQALIEPMSLDEKLEFFQLLVDLGFKEIEVGFPAASDTEYQFVRALIERNMIPDDVSIQVLTQAREHIIKKTFESLKGAKHAIVHLYNSTSRAQREQVFRKTKEEIKQLAVDGARMLKHLAGETEGNFSFEYSPESFSGTEVDYALEVCNAVLEVWEPTPEHKAIINIPTTVENAFPHVFGSQLEYMHKNLYRREAVVLSIHPHNDRGTGVATAEVGILAGADRVEGTLFGNGERTGNVDVVNIGMNLFSHGVDPGLDFSDMKHIVEVYEKLTNMKISPRQPYAGDLVFTAFSGSHQDAIAKGLTWKEEKQSPYWDVPYLPIDPKDVGRTYDSDVIRINSQSGKGGVSYVLKNHYGLILPEKMREEVGYAVKGVSDREHKELSPEWIYSIFEARYLRYQDLFTVVDCHFTQKEGITAEAVIRSDGKETTVTAAGNGRIDAVSNAIKQYFQLSYELAVYEEHALTRGSSSKAVAYIGVCRGGKTDWGVGIDEDIVRASIHALVVAVNHCLFCAGKGQDADIRLREILEFIQTNYRTVTLEELARRFYLSVPYLSKYIKEKSGKTFCDTVSEIRMQRACTLLRGETISVEKVAEKVGYPSVEHFNRQFKKRYGSTPLEYRNQR